MNKKILGIDIGSAFLKAVALKCDILSGRVSVTASALIDLEAAGGLESSLSSLFSDKGFKTGDVIFSLPAGSCSFRHLSLPFSEEKTIDEIITYELEPHLPDPIDTVIVDSLPISSAGGSTEVLAAAAKRRDVHELLQAAAGRRIAAIDTDAVPVALNLLESDAPDGTWILLDIGARSATAVFVQERTVVHVRSFAWGADHLSEADGGSPGTKRNRLQHFQEIADTLHLLGAKGLLGTLPSHLYLTGGGALSDPLRKDLEAFFKLPVLVVDLLQRRGITLPAKHPVAWDGPLMNQALALALRGMTLSKGLNFREEKPASKRELQGLRGHLPWTAVMLALFFLCIGADLTVRYYADSRKLGNLKAEIARTFKGSCPEVTRMVDPVRQLEQKIKEAKNLPGEMEKGPLFLEQWKKAMDTQPEHSGILVTGISCNAISLEINGEAPDYETINSWKSALEKAGSFADVQMHFGGGKQMEGKKTFRLRMTHAL